MQGNSFGIIGGDKRQVFLASLLKKDGKNVYLHGFDDKVLKEFDLESENLESLIIKSENLIFPLPISKKENKILFTEIIIDGEFIEKIKSKKIFCGIKNNIKIQGWKDLNPIDYSQSEDFKILNAQPTAEGVIKLMFENTDKIIFKSTCLIAGFGRIGKILSIILQKLGANVYVYTKSEEDRTWASVLGLRLVDDLNLKKEFDFILNTVPELIFIDKILDRINKECIIIDLASMSGVDLEYAAKIGLKVNHELGIPGRFFPRTAAEIIKKNIYKSCGVV